MPSIGGLSVIGFHKHPQLAGMALAARQRPGVHGFDFVELGFRGVPDTMIAELDAVSDDARASVIKAYNSLRGKNVAIVSNSGSTWNNFAVLGGRVLATIDMVIASGGINNGRFYLFYEFTVLPNSTSY